MLINSPEEEVSPRQLLSGSANEDILSFDRELKSELGILLKKTMIDSPKTELEALYELQYQPSLHAT